MRAPELCSRSGFQRLPPLSLYVHMPWCVRKCPYCDFNSHAVSTDGVPEAAYIDALLNDLDADLAHFAQDWSQRPLQSIFIGGGTPSLISPDGYARLFAGIRARLSWADDIEITLEANPGTVEQGLFEGYRAAGINRLSIGVQTFQGEQLKALGRIHSGDEALRAASTARSAGFERINLDLMHGLPGQSVAAACDDLAQAIALGVTHLSWYQLTLEPNTVFYRQQPILPDEEVLADIQEQGERLLAQAGFQRYEVSAFAQAGQACRHNLNYWQFGDYVGIGAGAHGKLSVASGEIWRTTKTRMPKDYLAAYSTVPSREKLGMAAYQAKLEGIASVDLPFEFMLNALRLTNGVPSAYWPERTGLAPSIIASTLADLRRQGLLENTTDRLQASALGLRFLNRAIDAFLPEHNGPASR